MRFCERPAEFRDIAQLARVKLGQIDEKVRALRAMRLRLWAMVVALLSFAVAMVLDLYSLSSV
ncbi:MAG TPA: hypothetical protein VIX37_05945 [Candidatus Sulfotelmatobacter sp.]